MRIPRIFIVSELAPELEIALDSQASNYLGKALRMEAGRQLFVFNGDGHEYSAILISTSKRECIIRIESQQAANRESPLHTHMAIGVSRGERMDWVLQKATELGVSEITPLFTERTEVKLKGERLDKKMEHWRQIMISACEQCQRNVLPKLNTAATMDEFFRLPKQGLGLVLHHRSEQRFSDHGTQQACTLLIGPEGGLTDTEIQQAMNSYQYSALTLGPRVLRTETAPIVALTALQLLWGDLK